MIEDVAAVALSLILPRNHSNHNKTSPIVFDLKNGKTVQFDTYLEDHKMEKIVDLVNLLVENKV